MRLNWLDRAIQPFAPRFAVKRAIARSYLEERGYDGAAMGRRTSGMRAPSTSADSEIAKALPMLRARMRELGRNSPHAKKALAVWTNNLVGTGIMPRAKSGDEKLDKAAMDLWEKWSRQADADGQLNIYGIMELAVREMVEGGEVLIRKRQRRPEDGLAVPLQLQIMEGDQLDGSKTAMNGGNRIINGVEIDVIGRRTAYWMFENHPGSMLTGFSLAGSLMSKPIPASEIIHLFRKERTQVRGTPWGSAIIRPLRDLDDYSIAEIVRKKTETCVVAIVTGAEPGSDRCVSPTTINRRSSKGAPLGSQERTDSVQNSKFLDASVDRVFSMA